LVVAGP
jgi:hypothetical protein